MAHERIAPATILLHQNFAPYPIARSSNTHRTPFLPHTPKSTNTALDSSNPIPNTDPVQIEVEANTLLHEIPSFADGHGWGVGHEPGADSSVHVGGR